MRCVQDDHPRERPATGAWTSRNMMLRLVDQVGVPRKQQRMSQAEIQEAIRLYEHGRSLASVCRQLYFDHTTVWKQLHQRDVAMRDSYGRER